MKKNPIFVNIITCIVLIILVFLLMLMYKIDYTTTPDLIHTCSFALKGQGTVFVSQSYCYQFYGGFSSMIVLILGSVVYNTIVNKNFRSPQK